jgi:hypothetical protein
LPETVEPIKCNVEVEKFCIAAPELVDVLFVIAVLIIVNVAGTLGEAEAALLRPPPFAAEFPVMIELEITNVPPTL